MLSSLTSNVRRWLPLGAFLLAAAPFASAQSYTFSVYQDITSLNSLYTAFDAPVLATSGLVAFGARGTVQSAFATRGAGLNALLNSGTTARASDGVNETITNVLSPVIGANGTIAFRGSTNSSTTGALYSAVYASVDGTTISTVADTKTSYSTVGNRIAVGPNGRVVFDASKTGTGSFSGIYDGQDATANRIFLNGTNGITAASNIGVSYDGRVGFTGAVNGATPAYSALYTTTGGDPTQVAKTATAAPGGGTYTTFYTPDFALDGRIAYTALLPTVGTTANSGVYVTDAAGNPTLVANSYGDFAGFSTSVGINAGGTVAFRASLDSGAFGLYTAQSGVVTRLIGSGDAFDGSTISTLSFTGGGLSDDGRLAFGATLADGRRVIGLAQTNPVPEPATLAALGLGAAALLRRRRAR